MKRFLVAALLTFISIIHSAADSKYILDNGKVRACFAGGVSFRAKELCLVLSGLTAMEAKL